MNQLFQLQNDLALLVVVQGEMINDIEKNM